MEKKVCLVKPKIQLKEKPIRVAAYCRVSSGKDAMLHSLSTQVSVYSELIQNHFNWEYAGVYADEAKTGTKDTRENFIRLLNDCRAGKIDMIITKSISRFARNTVTLLETVRELKNLGIDVFFEEQNIHTASAEGELMLSILASFAQEESLSASENQKWRIKKNFENGIPWTGSMLGYRMKKGKYEIVPKEAKIIKRIYEEYLAGDGATVIMNRLNEEGIRTMRGGLFNKNAIVYILRNYTYTGNLLLQRVYSENHLTKKKIHNNGELPMYHATDTHEAIIDLSTFEKVQLELTRRADYFAPQNASKEKYPFTGKIVCGNCGKNFRRKTTTSGIVWTCTTYNTKGKKYCDAKQIPENTLFALTAEMDISKITLIEALKDNTLIFHFDDGLKCVKQWKIRSRSESWTPEMREAARQKTLARN